MISRLSLERFKLTDLVIESNADFKSSSASGQNYHLEVEFDGATDGDNPLRYQFRLTVEAKPKQKECAYRRVHVASTGIFALPADASDSEKGLIPQAPLGMLYGMMRGIVANATALGPQVHLLPSVNVYEIVKAKAEEVAKKQVQPTQRKRPGKKK